MLSDTMMMGGGRKAAYSIENSLLFRGAQYLSRTPSVPGNRKVWTFSAWVRRNKLGVYQRVLNVRNSQWDAAALIFNTDDTLSFLDYAGNVQKVEKRTVAKFRDAAGWSHVLVAFDSENGSTRLYVNGEEITLFTINVDPPVGYAGWVNSTVMHQLGWDWYYQSAEGLVAQMAEVILIDGAALTPTSFGEWDSVTGSWRPKKVSAADWGANGFHLGEPWTAVSPGTDTSGQGNTWTAQGFTDTDVVTDSPTNVYAIWNRSATTWGSYGVMDDGNLRLTCSNYDDDRGASASLPVTSGKWVAEFLYTYTSTQRGAEIGLTTDPFFWGGSRPGSTGIAWGVASGAMYESAFNTYTSLPTSPWSSGDIIRMEVDLDVWEIRYFCNAILRHTKSIPASMRGQPLFIGGACRGGPSGVASLIANFGQRPWTHAPSAGFSALCTANMLPTSGLAAGTFTGGGGGDGPYVFTGAVPQTLSINGNPVTWGLHADRLATGFKIRTASTAYNSTGTNTWTATYDRKPTVGPKRRAPANAQGN